VPDLEQKKAEAWLGMKKVEVDILMFLKGKGERLDGAATKIQAIQDEVVSNPPLFSHYSTT